MKFHSTHLEGVVRLELRAIEDERGWFTRTFCAETFAAEGLETTFPQTNHSYCSSRGILRGLHYQQAPRAEAKLVRCVRGVIFDVAVDVRRDSTTFLQWFGTELSADRPEALYVGPGFAHGYQSLTDNAAILYQASEPYSPEREGCLRYDDPAIGIRWPMESPNLSAKDQRTPWIDSTFTGIVL
ncbi:dTDP-4-dehydrorhamnose 3,5-epimerase [Novipirellula aureliae]|uniref:dTDP-4-dehydrorhamnose 3,5-epimerase n=1 Tax=Novipirellula aureliae TaxID=2527966 RepID=A0A5C6E9D4_9BACT|nr:dTDP-4-dehydrorhamnose 3,5-epimerase [Novipirellula aureliae]TWU44341.1 dTDP-4-dehydrorhamnose 3,5-epimerase [Novipirellula aureliae]